MRSVRNSDLVARIDGDKFVIVLANIKQEAEAEKQRIIEEGKIMADKIEEKARFTIEQEYKKGFKTGYQRSSKERSA